MKKRKGSFLRAKLDETVRRALEVAVNEATEGFPAAYGRRPDDVAPEGTVPLPIVLPFLPFTPLGLELLLADTPPLAVKFEGGEDVYEALVLTDTVTCMNSHSETASPRRT
jgi:hypothetical protein